MERTKLEHYIGQVLVALENSQWFPRACQKALTLVIKFDASGTGRLIGLALL